MKVLFDIVHPADVLFFFRPIRRLVDKGAKIVIASRHKDIATELLDAFGLQHQPLSRAGSGMLGLARELLARDLNMLRLARRERPDVMVGFGGVAISHIGALLRIPSLSFYDSEHASLQIGLTLPFITQWHVPECWTGREARGRTYRFKAIKELSYLHPDEFSPDPEIARQVGWVPEKDNFLIRTVAWTAAHDRGRHGHGEAELNQLASFLAQRGAVHIVAEGPMPESIERYRYRGPVQDIHHLLGYCRLYVGESATMAAEAAVLGIPAVFTTLFNLGYIEELAKYGIVRVAAGGVDEILAAASEILLEPAASWQLRRDQALQGKQNMVDYIVQHIEAAAMAPRIPRQPS